MFNKIIETVVGGAIGLAALYVVAKVAYTAGHEMAEAKHRHDEFGKKTEAIEVSDDEGAGETDELVNYPTVSPVNKLGKFGMLMRMRKFIGKKSQSVIGHLMSDPEDHKLEAYITEGGVHIDIRKRNPMNPRQMLKGAVA